MQISKSLACPMDDRAGTANPASIKGRSGWIEPNRTSPEPHQIDGVCLSVVYNIFYHLLIIYRSYFARNFNFYPCNHSDFFLCMEWNTVLQICLKISFLNPIAHSSLQ